MTNGNDERNGGSVRNETSRNGVRSGMRNEARNELCLSGELRLYGVEAWLTFGVARPNDVQSGRQKQGMETKLERNTAASGDCVLASER
jgi:hypothetical protein